MEKTKKTTPLLSAGLLLVLNIFLFGPFQTYRLNLEEFSVSFLTIMGALLILAAILLLALSLVGLVLPERSFSRYISVLFMLGVLTWLQANFIQWEYGMLDGFGIDWEDSAWRGWVDGALWILLLGAALLFHKRISKVAASASVLLVLVQFAGIVVLGLKTPQIWTQHAQVDESDLVPPDEIFEFSSDRNVIHVIFDAFPSYAFEELINERPDHYREVLDGFVFYKETLGAFPTTFVSVPAFMGGQIYKNHMPMRDFLDAVLGGTSITNAAYDSGFEVDFVDKTRFFYGREGAKFSNFYTIPVPYRAGSQVLERRNAALMLDLVLFRSAPDSVRRKIYNNQRWLFQRWFSEKPHERFIVFSHMAFLDDLISKMSSRREPPVYKLIHLVHTHAPFVIGEDGNFAGEPLAVNLGNAMYQYRVAVDQFVEFLGALKAMDLYESSLIVFHSDHGQRAFKMPDMDSTLDDGLGWVASSALPLMLIKPPYAKGPLEISEAPTMLSDVPVTIASLLGLPERFDGMSMIEMTPGQSRVRSYRYYEWLTRYNNSDFMDWIEEYRVEGSAFDSASWQPSSIYRPGATTLEQQEGPVSEEVYELGDDQKELLAVDGSSIAVNSSRLVGGVEFVVSDSARLVVNGWAVDLGQGDVPETIVVFEKDRFVHAGRPDRRCPDSECRQRTAESKKQYGNPEVSMSGFRFDLPVSRFDKLDTATLRVFAVSKGGEASELAER